ncbi:MAG: rRNA cytosine-C5-methylase [Alistipes sp.]|nr:rRNA cytosine-C5-methylase [Alistipes sp.]
MSENPTLPPDFLESLRLQLGETEASQLQEALQHTPSPVSIRFNPYKIHTPPTGTAVPWCRYGYYLPERPSFTLDPLFHGGGYYVQEASSMFLEYLFRQVAEEGATPRRILDLCAAPGGKSTLLATLAGVEGLVVANEVIRSRASILADNALKWGIGNIAVTHNDPAHFAAFEHFFDWVVVDAPCSGEGMFRKDPNARSQWSASNVALCASRQRRILSDIWPTLRPGGYLIYSTCTFNPQENEENIAWIQSQYDCAPVTLTPPPDAWGVVCDRVQEAPVFHFYPHRVEGEGFFTAILRKGEGRLRERTPKPRKTLFQSLSKQETAQAAAWVGQPEYMRFYKINDTVYGYYAAAVAPMRTLAENLTMIHSGVPLGQFFGSKLKPAHALALFHDLRDETPSVSLDQEMALRYLRKQEIEPQRFAEGLNRVCYEGLGIGWIKRIGQRTNNLYPPNLRILTM